MLKEVHQACGFAAVRYNQIMEAVDALVTMKPSDASPLGNTLNLEGMRTILTSHDPFHQVQHGVGKDFVKLACGSGRRKVTVEEYAESITTLRPSAAVLLADVPPFFAGKRRTQKAVERTTVWSKQIIDHCNAKLGEGQAPALLAPLLASANRERRVQNVTASVESYEKGAVAGFAILGLFCGETRQDRLEFLADVTSRLPVDAPVMLCGGSDPLAVADALAFGICIIDSPVALELAQDRALAAWRWPGAGVAAPPPGSSADGADALGCDGGVVNLLDKQLAADERPLAPGCSCYACRRYSRAYVHHLLHVHEMLGDVLVTMCNTQRLADFVSAAGAAVEAEAGVGAAVPAAPAEAGGAAVPATKERGAFFDAVWQMNGIVLDEDDGTPA